MATTTNTLLLAFFDSLGEGITPDANFAAPTAYPLANISNSELFARSRTPDLTADRQLTWDHGSPVETNVIGFFGTNATLTTTRRYRAADDAAFTIGVVESGPILTSAFNTSIITRTVYVPPWGRSIIYVHPTSHTKRYRRWHQTDSANPDGFQEWGIVRYGLGLQLPFSTWKKDHHPEGPPGSQKILRGHEIHFHNLTRDQSYDLENLALTSLSTRRMLVIPEGNTPATYLFDAIWGVLESIYVRESIADTPYSDKRYRVTMTFREVDR